MDFAKHILVGTDFSKGSENAIRNAVTLAKGMTARLTLIHVYDAVPFVPPVAPAATVGANIEAELRGAVEKALQKNRDELTSEIADVATVAIQHRNAATGIVGWAKEHNVDLIVTSTHGRGGIAHLLIGSVAEQVVRHAECPVLTIRSKLA